MSENSYEWSESSNVIKMFDFFCFVILIYFHCFREILKLNTICILVEKRNCFHYISHNKSYIAGSQVYLLLCKALQAYLAKYSNTFIFTMHDWLTGWLLLKFENYSRFSYIEWN